MKIGDRIKSRRIELNMSVDELANKLGKNRATIYRYENNEIENLSTTTLEPLAIALETTPAHLMGWKEDINTIAAHHDGEWTEAELEEIEKFKEFVRSKRNSK